MESFLYEVSATHKDGESLALTKHVLVVPQSQTKRLTSKRTSQERRKRNNNDKTKTTVKATAC